MPKRGGMLQGGENVTDERHRRLCDITALAVLGIPTLRCEGLVHRGHRTIPMRLCLSIVSDPVLWLALYRNQQKNREMQEKKKV